MASDWLFSAIMPHVGVNCFCAFYFRLSLTFRRFSYVFLLLAALPRIRFSWIEYTYIVAFDWKSVEWIRRNRINLSERVNWVHFNDFTANGLFERKSHKVFELILFSTAPHRPIVVAQKTGRQRKRCSEKGKFEWWRGRTSNADCWHADSIQRNKLFILTVTFDTFR